MVCFGWHKLCIKTLSLAYRLEYFDAKDATAGLGLLAGTSVVGNTLSLNYKVELDYYSGPLRYCF
jgi:hypothetical protein